MYRKFASRLYGCENRLDDTIQELCDKMGYHKYSVRYLPATASDPERIQIVMGNGNEEEERVLYTLEDVAQFVSIPSLIVSKDTDGNTVLMYEDDDYEEEERRVTPCGCVIFNDCRECGCYSICGVD